METDEDINCMLLCRDGNEQAFRFLYTKYRKKIINYCYRFFSENRLAEEVTQDIFIKVYKAAPDYQPEAKFSTWLFRIATNTCLNAVRKSDHQINLQTLDDNDLDQNTQYDGTAADHQLEKQEQHWLVQQAMKQLPIKQRAAILLRIDHEFSYTEIAAQLDCSESSIKSLIFRARETLASSLETLAKEYKQ